MPGTDEPTQEPQSRPINPYVGPRAFKEGERLFGRQHERGELLDILIAQRIVLMYSPSGAGKSSLVEAALRPALRDNGFRVQPTIRLNLPPANGDAPDERFIVSTVASLTNDLQAAAGDGRPCTIDGALDALAVAAGEADDPLPEVLIIDQFEEILTTEARTERGRAARGAWFTQMGAVLRDRNRWALFCLREDYLAGLDPYLDALPSRLRARYRLDLLQVDAAAEAIRGPAEAAGVDYDVDPDAAMQLVENLASVVIYRDGRREEVKGRYVEPVQLQVVCQELWEQLDWPTLSHANNRILITAADVGEQAKQVDVALSQYYGRTVESIASDLLRPESDQVGDDADTVTGERRLREWIDTYLITEQGTRRPVQEGSPELNEFPGPVIQALERAHLVRGDDRASGRWLELSHDRLIGPIRENNANWFEENLQPFQKHARIWDQQGRDRTLLLSSEALAAAEEWLQDHPAALQPYEQDFLHESRALEQERIAANTREARHRRRLRIRAWIALGFALLALLTAGLATISWLGSVKMANSANVNRLLAQAGGAVTSGDLDRAAHLAVLAHHFDDKSEHEFSNDVLATLWQVSGQIMPEELALDRTLESAHDRDVLSLAVTPDSKQVISGGKDNMIFVQDLVGTSPPLRLDVGGNVRTLAVSGDGTHLAAGICIDSSADGRCGENRVVVYKGAGGGWTEPLDLPADTGVIRSVAFHPTQPQILAVGSEDGVLRIWDVGNRSLLAEVQTGAAGGITAMVFNPAGNLLAVAVCGNRAAPTVCQDKSGEVLLYDTTNVAATDLSSRLTDGPTNEIKTVAFNPDGTSLAAGGGDRTVRLWTSNPPSEPNAGDAPGAGGPEWSTARTLGKHTATVTAVAFHPSQPWVISSGQDKKLRVWSTVPPAHQVTVIPANALYGLVFDPSGSFLVGGGAGGEITTWPASALGSQSAFVVSTGTESVWDLGLSNADRLLVGVGSDNGSSGSAILWDLREETPQIVVLTPDGSSTIWAVGISQEGECAAAGGNNGEIFLWNLGDTAQRTQLQSATSSPVRSVEFASDGTYLVAGQWNGDVTLWRLDCQNPTAGAEPIILQSQMPGAATYARGSVRSLALRSSGDKADVLAIGGCTDVPEEIGTCTEGAFLFLRDLESGQVAKVCCTKLNPDDTPYALAFSTDGSTLVSGDLDGRIEIWCDVDTRMRNDQGFGDPDAVWRQHTASVRSLAFSDDGRTLFSASDDGTTLMWNLAAWECGNQIPVPVQVWPLATTDQSPVRGAVWSKTQRSLVLGISNGDLRFLSFDAAKLAAELCQQVGPGDESEWDGIVSYGPLDRIAHRIGERPNPNDVCADAPRPTPTSEPESAAPP